MRRKPPAHASADFIVTGEASVKKLSMRLAASGLVITKYALASWTVKCTDRATGEEIYFNTTLPKAAGSWASEEEALRAIGTKVADEFSRDFFLTHVPIRGRKVTLIVAGLPDATTEALLARELIGLPAVIAASAEPPAQPRTYDVETTPGTGSDAIVSDIIAPAQREARRGVLQRRRERRRARVDRVRRPLRGRPRGTLRNQSAGRPVRRIARAPEGGHHEPGNAAQADGLG